MNTNVNACMPSEIYVNCYPEDGLDWPKYAKHCLMFQKDGCKLLCQSRVKYFKLYAPALYSYYVLLLNFYPELPKFYYIGH